MNWTIKKIMVSQLIKNLLSDELIKRSNYFYQGAAMPRKSNKLIHSN